MRLNIRQICRGCRGKWFATLAGCTLCASGLSGAASAVETEWSFDNASLLPESTDHPATSMIFVLDTANVVTFGTASSYGLPAMPGGDATAMHFNAFTNAQGLAVYDVAPPNGTLPDTTPALKVNSYTMAWDILYPSITGFISLYQTQFDNSTDGDFFIRGDGAIGISGNYDITNPPNNWATWTRVVLSVDPVNHLLNKYVNGTLLEAQSHSDATFDDRWALNADGSPIDPPFADFFVLMDEDDETADGYISNFYFTDRVVDSATIAAWGGADFDGVKSVPEPSTYALAILGMFGILAGKRSLRKVAAAKSSRPVVVAHGQGNSSVIPWPAYSTTV